ncbi:hypothetical protein ACX818_001245 [Acinetobacter baumannii]
MLSNLYHKPFIMDNMFFGSIEGFLQGTRYQDPDEQRKIFEKSGIDAKRAGREMPIKNDTLYWQGKPMHRLSERYINLCTKAFECCFAQNTIFQKALYESIGSKLEHSIGKNDPLQTILTNDEFIGNLDILRRKYTKFLTKLYGNTNEK